MRSPSPSPQRHIMNTNTSTAEQLAQLLEAEPSLATQLQEARDDTTFEDILLDAAHQHGIALERAGLQAFMAQALHGSGAEVEDGQLEQVAGGHPITPFDPMRTLITIRHPIRRPGEELE